MGPWRWRCINDTKPLRFRSILRGGPLTHLPAIRSFLEYLVIWLSVGALPAPRGSDGIAPLSPLPAGSVGAIRSVRRGLEGAASGRIGRRGHDVGPAGIRMTSRARSGDSDPLFLALPAL